MTSSGTVFAEGEGDFHRHRETVFDFDTQGKNEKTLQDNMQKRKNVDRIKSINLEESCSVFFYAD